MSHRSRLLNVLGLSLVLASATFATAQEHLKCYKIKDPLKLAGTLDLDTPKFGADPGCRISKAKMYCVPSTATNVAVVDKNTGDPIVPEPTPGTNPGARICYKVTCPSVAPDVTVADQFGSRTATKLKAMMVCTPTAGAGATDPVRVFSVTNTMPGGTFGNRAATTARCAGAATAQGLSCTSTVALLAYGAGDDVASLPANHGVPSDAPIVAAGSEVKIADDWADLLDGSWDTCVGRGCDSGTTAGGLAGEFYLIGANNDGTVDGANNCADWSSTTGTFRLAQDNCSGNASPGCGAGETFAVDVCNNPGCCGTTQGSMLCLCY